MQENSLPAMQAYTLSPIPQDNENCGIFIEKAHDDIEALKCYLKSLGHLSKEEYSDKLVKTQDYADALLDYELKIANFIKAIPTQQGRRTDLKTDSHAVTKSETIASMGLSKKQARLIEGLDADSVEQAKKEARNNGEIVTRTMALNLKKQKHYEENNKKIKWEGCFNPNATAESYSIEPLYYTQLFSNVGIGEFYLENLNVKVAVANELVQSRAQWYKEHHPNAEVVCGDITNKTVFNSLVALHKEKGCKLILASPPCQDFSLAGKRDFKTPRAKLFLTMLDFIKEVNDVNEYVMIENVPEFLDAKPEGLNNILKGETIGEYIKSTLSNFGYQVNIDVLDAADYDTAQHRKRGIILASKIGVWAFPKKSDTQIMLWEAIGDLPSLEAGMKSGIPYHNAPALDANIVEVLRHTPTGCSAHDNPENYKPVKKDGSKSNASFKSSFQRKEWSKPCNTITMKSNNATGHRTIHPGRPKTDGTWSDARCLTVLEMLRVTGLPDDYPIPSWASENLVYDVIGECFCPKLVKKLLLELIDLIEKTKEREILPFFLIRIGSFVIRILIKARKNYVLNNNRIYVI